MNKPSKARCPTCGVVMHPDQVRILLFITKKKSVDFNKFTLKSFAKATGATNHPQKIKFCIEQLERKGHIVHDKFTNIITLREYE